MKGTVKSVKKYGKPFFFIEGEDGNIYFSHKQELIVPEGGSLARVWKYIWNGANVTFEVQKTDKEHDRAIQIVPEPVKDPYEKERRERMKKEKEEAEIRRAAEEERHRKNREINEESSIKLNNTVGME